MIVVKSEPDLVNLISLADLTISAGGYNTVNEIRATRSPAVLLPSPRTHDDQIERVRAFEDRGLAIVLSGLKVAQTVERIVGICTDSKELSKIRKRYASDEMETGNSRAADRILELCQVSQTQTSGCEVTQFIATGCASLKGFLQNRGDQFVNCCGRILHHAPLERLVVEFEATSHRQSNTSYIGKFYLEPQSDLGRNSFETMSTLQGALVDSLESDLVLRIPTANYYDPVIQCLFQQKASGVPYTDLVGTDTLRFALHQAGVALSQLHSLRLVDMRPKSLVDHVSELIRPHPTLLGEHFPEYRQTITDCLDLLRHRDMDCREGLPIGPIHRDFQMRQLFLHGQCVWLVDWDLFAYGDPAFDVGYFVAYLQTHLSENDFSSARDAFLRGYLKSGSAAVLEQLPVYLVFNYLRRACRRFRIRDENWRSEIRRMMQMIESK